MTPTINESADRISWAFRANNFCCQPNWSGEDHNKSYLHNDGGKTGHALDHKGYGVTEFPNKIAPPTSIANTKITHAIVASQAATDQATDFLWRMPTAHGLLTAITIAARYLAMPSKGDGNVVKRVAYTQ